MCMGGTLWESDNRRRVWRLSSLSSSNLKKNTPALTKLISFRGVYTGHTYNMLQVLTNERSFRHITNIKQ